MFDVDIIVVARNQINFTKGCIESIFENVSERFHLIVVDNGSTDETPAYLKEIENRRVARAKTTIVTNLENQGYALGLNQGLTHSNAPFVLFCNNDIEFYINAITEMILIARTNKLFGLVNPNSNEFGLSSYDPKDVERQRGKWVERCHTSGFCVLVKREVIQKIGGIDPVFSPAYFEDMDYAERTKQAGFLCVVAKGAYVHHYGTRTFLPAEKQELWNKHKEIFKTKWGGTKWFSYVGDHRLLSDKFYREQVRHALLELARSETAVIYLFIPRQLASFFQDAHDSFRIITVSSLFRPFMALGKVFLSHGKKPISRLYVSNQASLGLWTRTKCLHHAQTFLLPVKMVNHN